MRMINICVMEFEESLRVVEKWLCRMCMSIHAMSRACHHPHDLVHSTHGTKGIESHIVDIVKSSSTDSDNLKANEELVLDARLLEKILIAPIFSVKSISLSRRLAFS